MHVACSSLDVHYRKMRHQDQDDHSRHYLTDGVARSALLALKIPPVVEMRGNHRSRKDHNADHHLNGHANCNYQLDNNDSLAGVAVADREYSDNLLLLSFVGLAEN